MKSFVLFSLMVFPATVLGVDYKISVPEREAAAVVIDGKISGGEWDGARETEIAPGVTLHMFQTKEYVWVAVKLPAKSLSYVDVFLLLENGKRINLHASMQVGERDLPEKGWTDQDPATKWGILDGWQANFVKQLPGKPDSAPLSEVLSPYDGFEFCLSKKRFVGQIWQLRLEVRDFAGKQADIVFPAKSDRFETSGWATISLASAIKNP